MAKQEFNEKYHEAEEQYRSRVIPLHEKERQLRETIRKDLSLEDSEKQERYMSAFQEIEQEFEDLAYAEFARQENERDALKKRVHEGQGDDYSSHLMSLANTPTERLEELMSTAERTGQEVLARAIAETALERNQFGLFHRYAERDPEMADALRRYRTMPDTERLQTRLFALRPPRADASSLEPTAADVEAYWEEQRSNSAARRAFYNLPTLGTKGNPIRRVGGRTNDPRTA